MPRKIVVEVKGGLIQDITGIPPGIEVEVRDYDIEGSWNEEELDVDEAGKAHFTAIWKEHTDT